jgi:hypothetical protein
MGREGFEPSTLGLREGLGSLGRFRRAWFGAVFVGSTRDRSWSGSVLLPSCCPTLASPMAEAQSAGLKGSSAIVLGTGPLTNSFLAIVIACAALAVSLWQAIVRWHQFRAERRARLAVDVSPLASDSDGWQIEVWLTNVGGSHARRVRVWLEDLDGNRVSEKEGLRRPLLAGGESQTVILRVPKNGPRTVRAVRVWRDAEGDHDPDPSDQEILLQ